MITFFYDYYHLIIPNLMVTMTTVLVVLILLYNFWQNGEADWLSHLLSGVGAFVFFGGLWVVSKGRWIGLGDAKLAFPLATLLGPSGAFTFVVGSFWVGSIISLGIMGALYLYKRGQPHLPIRQIHFTIKSEVPFAPFIIISFIIVYAFSFDVLEALDWFLL